MAVTINGSTGLTGVAAIDNVSSTELGYVDGVTSAIQTQINNNAPGATGIPYRIAAGTQYGGAGSTTITFPSSRFTVTPILIAINGENTARSITALSSSSFTYINAGGANATINWTAIQMTSSAAAG